MIEVSNLTKAFGSRLAVDDVGFTVADGDVVGFLGQNGAGKTTTMRMITGYLVPDKGSITVAGVDMISDSLAARGLIGYLPESVPLYRDMTTRRYLEFMARLRGLDRRRTRARLDEVIELCGLGEYRDSSIAKLSKGYRQRVGLGQAIIHDPPVLILDEPTIGIDPLQVVQTKQLIKELGRDRTILISSHVLPEVSTLCERVIIIHKGRVVAEDSIQNLSSRIAGEQRLRVRVGGPAEAVTERLQAVSCVRAVSFSEPFHIVEYGLGEEPQAEIARVVVESGWALLATEAMDLTLEDIFLELTASPQAGLGAAIGQPGEEPAR